MIPFISAAALSAAIATNPPKPAPRLGIPRGEVPRLVTPDPRPKPPETSSETAACEAAYWSARVGALLGSVHLWLRAG